VNALIVEDNEEKCRHLSTFLRGELPTFEIVERHSYNTGLAALRDLLPDLVLLDMSMPTFDRRGAQAGGRMRPYAGRDILHEMKRMELPSRAIVVTQFETFGEGRQRKTLDELRHELATEFKTSYLGTVYYHPSRSDWRTELSRLLRTALGLPPLPPTNK
jgi:CheY-like chemotaxis protein